jgi:hypothetical protein
MTFGALLVYSGLRDPLSEMSMPDPVDALIVDLLEWIGPRGRPYAEVMDAWRTSCPRLPVWEEANTRGYIVHEPVDEGGGLISISPGGLALLRQRGCEFQRRDDA